MPGNPEIAVVILNWNGKKLFDTFLPSVIKHSDRDNIKIIVADNGSNDDSVDYLQQRFPQVKIIELKKNYA